MSRLQEHLERECGFGGDEAVLKIAVAEKIGSR
jgi:hypothetical protein